MVRVILFLFLSSIFSFHALAKEEILSVTDNNDNKEIYYLVVIVDDNTQSLQGLVQDTYVNEKKVKRVILNPLDLATSEGMILEKRGNRNILNLKSNNFDYSLGGVITIDTLYNAIKGERRSFEVDLAKDSEGWKLFKDHKVVTKFHVKVNKVVIVGTVGIKTIIME